MPPISLNTAVLIALGAAVAILAILLGVTMNRLSRVTDRLYHASPNDDHDGESGDMLRDDLQSRVKQLDRQIAALNLAQKRGISRVGLVRFNPFEDTGGDLSFALTLASADGNGVVITSLHGRGNTRFYAKPLASWTPAYSLSDEEAESVHRAQEAL